jgi:hypothetical protein
MSYVALDLFQHLSGMHGVCSRLKMVDIGLISLVAALYSLLYHYAMS